MDIISLYSTTVAYLASKVIEFGEKRKKGYYAVQGHSRSSRSVPIESRYDNLSRYRSLLFKFWTLCVFEPPFGEHVVDFLLMLIKLFFR